MKKDIHMKMNPVVFRDSSAGVDFYTTSTISEGERETKDGVEYIVVPVEVSSASHPFFTGKGNVIDTAGRVDRFKSRAQKRKQDTSKNEE